MPTDYTRSEIEVVVDLIRKDNQDRPLTSGQITFGRPSVFTPIPGFDRNTIVVATSIPGRGFRGNQTFYYNRVPLSKFVPPDSPEILYFDDSELTKVSELLPELNRRLKTNITPDKVIEQNLPVFGEGDPRPYADVSLMMRNESLVYTDQVILRILRGDIDLTTIIPVTELTGLTYAPPA